jgi:hypothetical protein
MSHAPDEADHDEGQTGTDWRVGLRRSGSAGVTLRSGTDANPAVPRDCRFDELVVDQWFHLEWMDGDQWWARIGDARISVTIDESGIPTVDIERGVYGDVKGTTKLDDSEARGDGKA